MSRKCAYIDVSPESRVIIWRQTEDAR